MISPEEEEYILREAYVPEHIVRLMVGISEGEPYLANGYVFFAKENWLIFIGYPVAREFKAEDFTATLQKTIKQFSPACTWFIAPEVPDSILAAARQRESDEYYKLDLHSYEAPKDLIRQIRKAGKNLEVEKSRKYTPDHATLTQEFLQREKPSAKVKELFLRIPQYVAHSQTSLLLNAWDRSKKLSAFYVVELAAHKFADYVVGCFSKENYAAHSSDLLFLEMINLAKENHKQYIHLGLGVNEGIRKFKRKWGGIPFLKYEFGELSDESKGPISWIKALEAKL